MKSILIGQRVAGSRPPPPVHYTTRLLHRKGTTRRRFVPSGSSVVLPAVATSFSVTAERGRGVPTFDTRALRACPSDACRLWSFPPPSFPRARNHACRAANRSLADVLRQARYLTRSRDSSLSLRAFSARNADMILRQQLEHNGIVKASELNVFRFWFRNIGIGSISLSILTGFSLLDRAYSVV